MDIQTKELKKKVEKSFRDYEDWFWSLDLLSPHAELDGLHCLAEEEMSDIWNTEFLKDMPLVGLIKGESMTTLAERIAERVVESNRAARLTGRPAILSGLPSGIDKTKRITGLAIGKIKWNGEVEFFVIDEDLRELQKGHANGEVEIYLIRKRA